MDVSVLRGVFMLLSCPGCHGIQCLQIFDKKWEKERFQNTFANTSVYSLTTFEPRGSLIYQRKIMEEKNFTVWISEPFIDTHKLVLTI